MDNLESDMGVLIVASSGQSISARLMRKEYQWPAMTRLPVTVVLRRYAKGLGEA